MFSESLYLYTMEKYVINCYVFIICIYTYKGEIYKLLCGAVKYVRVLVIYLLKHDIYIYI